MVLLPTCIFQTTYLSHSETHFYPNFEFELVEHEDRWVNIIISLEAQICMWFPSSPHASQPTFSSIFGTLWQELNILANMRTPASTFFRCLGNSWKTHTFFFEIVSSKAQDTLSMQGFYFVVRSACLKGWGQKGIRKD